MKQTTKETILDYIIATIIGAIAGYYAVIIFFANS
jgi:hypothetical protein